MDPFTQDSNHLPDGAIHHTASTLAGGSPGTTLLAAPLQPDREARGKTIAPKRGEAQYGKREGSPIPGSKQIRFHYMHTKSF